MTTHRPAIRHIAAFGALVILAATTAGAQEAPPIARYVPSTPDAAHVFVLDSAHILAPATVAALQDSARALQTETGADVAWVTLPTLGGRPIEEAALYIGRRWRIGSPGQPGEPLRNRGLVILFVPDKSTTAGSNFRIEVGNGLEGTITDSRSRAISAAMRQDLKAKRYDAAYLAGWLVAARLVREDFNARAVADIAPTPPAPPQNVVPLTSSTHTSFAISELVVVAFVLAMIWVGLVSSRRRARAWVASSPGFIPIPFDNNTATSTNDDDEARRRSTWQSFDSSSSSGSSGDSGGSSSGGGDFGGGGGFSGGGSSDTI